MCFVSMTSRGQGLLLRCRIFGLCRNAARLGKQEAWRWGGGMTPVPGGGSSHPGEAAACRLCIERRPCPVSFDSAPSPPGVSMRLFCSCSMVSDITSPQTSPDRRPSLLLLMLAESSDMCRSRRGPSQTAFRDAFLW